MLLYRYSFIMSSSYTPFHTRPHTQTHACTRARAHPHTHTHTRTLFISIAGNRPVVENIYRVRLDNSLIPVIPVESAFGENPVYSYDSSLQVQMILPQKEDRFMEIDNDKATYVLRKSTFLND